MNAATRQHERGINEAPSDVAHGLFHKWVTWPTRSWAPPKKKAHPREIAGWALGLIGETANQHYHKALGNWLHKRHTTTKSGLPVRDHTQHCFRLLYAAPVQQVTMPVCGLRTRDFSSLSVALVAARHPARSGPDRAS
jgi:hypothetical protein